MRACLLIAAVVVVQVAYGQNLVVFAREDTCSADRPCKRTSTTETAFFGSYTKASKLGFAQKTSRRLETPPPEWGKKLSDHTYGSIDHQESFGGGLVADLSLFYMEPNHRYRLCLNGRPGLPGNELLPATVRGSEKEKYYDFLTITANPRGEYHGSLAVMLKPGDYHVRFYVKDIDDFKIVLYHDYFKFTVK